MVEFSTRWFSVLPRIESSFEFFGRSEFSKKDFENKENIVHESSCSFLRVKSGERSQVRKVVSRAYELDLNLSQFVTQASFLTRNCFLCYGTRCRDIYFLYERNINLARCFLAHFSPGFELTSFFPCSYFNRRISTDWKKPELIKGKNQENGLREIKWSCPRIIRVKSPWNYIDKLYFPREFRFQPLFTHVEHIFYALYPKNQ